MHQPPAVLRVDPICGNLGRLIERRHVGVGPLWYTLRMVIAAVASCERLPLQCAPLRALGVQMRVRLCLPCTDDVGARSAATSQAQPASALHPRAFGRLDAVALPQRLPRRRCPSVSVGSLHRGDALCLSVDFRNRTKDHRYMPLLRSLIALIAFFTLGCVDLREGGPENSSVDPSMVRARQSLIRAPPTLEVGEDCSNTGQDGCISKLCLRVTPRQGRYICTNACTPSQPCPVDFDCTNLAGLPEALCTPRAAWTPQIAQRRAPVLPQGPSKLDAGQATPTPITDGGAR